MTQVSANFNFSVIQNVFIYRRNNFSLFPFRFPFLFLFFSKYKVRVTKYIFFFSIRAKIFLPTIFFFHVTKTRQKNVIKSSKSVLGRSPRMRPIASNYSEKLKHDSFVLLYFFVCFYFVLFYTCVNIFVLLKAPGEEGPVLYNISQFYSTNEQKLHRNISLRCCFSWLRDTLHKRRCTGVRMTLRSLEIRVGTSKPSVRTRRGVHV